MLVTVHHIHPKLILADNARVYPNGVTLWQTPSLACKYLTRVGKKNIQIIINVVIQPRRQAGSAKASGKNPKSFLGRVFNFNLFFFIMGELHGIRERER